MIYKKEFSIENISFHEDYLNPLINLTKLVFIKFNEENDLDIYQQINEYMQKSDIRKGMDNGNWKDLNKGWKQVYNSIDKSNLSIGEKLDDTMLHWLAEIYTYWQWRYKHLSMDINQKCPAKELAKLYYPLHETSTEIACQKLECKFFGGVRE